MKKINQKDKALLKFAGIQNPRQWGKKSQDWESATYTHFRTGQTVAIRR